MRTTKTILLLLLVAAGTVLLVPAAPTGAQPIVYTDTYGGNHNPAVTCCSGDVIGELGGFDIESITFTQWSPSSIKGDIKFNYNFGDATLADYVFDPAHPSGSGLKVGDLLFSVGGTFKYGMPLVSHDGLTAGSLYSITHVLTSNDFGLDSSRYIWRFNTPVRIDPIGSTLLTTGSVSTSNIGFYEVDANFNLVPGSSFYTEFSNNAMVVQFASAICANDVLMALIEAPSVHMPEPSTWMLLCFGLIGLAVWQWRQRPVAVVSSSYLPDLMSSSSAHYIELPTLVSRPRAS